LPRGGPGGAHPTPPSKNPPAEADEAKSSKNPPPKFHPPRPFVTPLRVPPNRVPHEKGRPYSPTPLPQPRRRYSLHRSDRLPQLLLPPAFAPLNPEKCQAPYDAVHSAPRCSRSL